MSRAVLASVFASIMRGFFSGFHVDGMLGSDLLFSSVCGQNGSTLYVSNYNGHPFLDPETSILRRASDMSFSHMIRPSAWAAATRLLR